MKPRILQQQVLPSILWFILLFLIARIADEVLHKTGYAGVGRYLGVPGTLVILFSFVYSLRKRHILNFGRIKPFLKLHEVMAWLGSLMLLVHAGIHMHAVMPWAALIAMMILVASGFTGAYLQRSAQAKIVESREHMSKKGLDEDKIEEALYLDSLAVDVMKKWRIVHITITSFFAALATFHIVSILWYWVK